MRDDCGAIEVQLFVLRMKWRSELTFATGGKSWKELLTLVGSETKMLLPVAWAFAEGWGHGASIVERLMMLNDTTSDGYMCCSHIRACMWG